MVTKNQIKEMCENIKPYSEWTGKDFVEWWEVLKEDPNIELSNMFDLALQVGRKNEKRNKETE